MMGKWSGRLVKQVDIILGSRRGTDIYEAITHGPRIETQVGAQETHIFTMHL